MKCLALSVTLIGFTSITGLFSQQRTFHGSYDPEKKHQVRDLQVDLEILRSALLKTHPGLFWYQSEKDFSTNYAETRAAIREPMTERVFLSLITPFVANIKCGHTDISISEKFDKYCYQHLKYFPFSVKIIDSRIFISRNISNDHSIDLGTEVLSVNGVNKDSLLGMMRPFGWSDGFRTSDTRIQYGFHNLLRHLFNSPGKFTLGLVDPDGNSRQVEVEALDVKTLEERFLTRPALTRYQVDAGKKYNPFRFSELDSLSTAIIRIDGFEGKNYLRFLKKSFGILKDKGTKNLIIDLRGNGGGEDDYGRFLYSFIALKEYSYYDHLEVVVEDPNDTIFKYGKMPVGKLRMNFFHVFRLKRTGESRYVLKNGAHPNLRKKPFRPQKNNFKGNVFVLIDEESYSATTEFCAVTHYNQRAKFIGRETGGSYCGNTSGIGFALTLPHTGIQVEIPMIGYYSAVDGPWGQGISPDYMLREEIKDLIQNRDTDLLFTLDLIRRSHQK